MINMLNLLLLQMSRRSLWTRVLFTEVWGRRQSFPASSTGSPRPPWGGTGRPWSSTGMGTGWWSCLVIGEDWGAWNCYWSANNCYFASLWLLVTHWLIVSSIDHNFPRSSDIPIESREVKPMPYFMALSGCPAQAQCQCLFSSLLFYYSPRWLIRRHLTIDIQQSLHYNFLANRRLRVTFFLSS